MLNKHKETLLQRKKEHIANYVNELTYRHITKHPRIFINFKTHENRKIPSIEFPLTFKKKSEKFSNRTKKTIQKFS